VHDPLANYANTGMRPALADIVSMEGISRHNQKRGESARQAKLSAVEKQAENIHASFRGEPFHYNPSFLCFLNDQAKKLGLPLPHPSAKPFGKDTGERFLYEAFKEAKE
jgi:hypothetical protein